MKLLIYGANGPTGRAVVQQAIQAGHSVTAVTRHPETFDLTDQLLTVLKGDATDEASVREALPGHDAVLSALGLPYTRKPVTLYSVSAHLVIDVMREHGIRRLIAVSSSEVEKAPKRTGFVTDHVVAPLLRNVVGKTLYDDMVRMEGMLQGSGLDWTVVRPPALTDHDTVTNYQVAERYVAGTFAARTDIADFMLRQAEDDRWARQIVGIASPEIRSSVFKTIWDSRPGART